MSKFFKGRFFCSEFLLKPPEGITRCYDETTRNLFSRVHAFTARARGRAERMGTKKKGNGAHAHLEPVADLDVARVSDVDCARAPACWKSVLIHRDANACVFDCDRDGRL